MQNILFIVRADALSSFSDLTTTQGWKQWIDFNYSSII